MKGQAPHIETPDESISASTNRFFLENLVWNCLCQAMKACPANQAVSIRVEKADSLVRIRFCGLDRVALDSIDGFPASQDTAVVHLLNGRLIIDNETCEICIIIP